ncbi:unnamed protein product [Mesocestoides corti]|uniref:Aspartic peptidase DDI1-type domain-containing protein n=1 Tax=Mesocestoides corti TaxID=53468 RepID=A0A3P6HB27_MESCO|nr:unnamed protein product [Mesocestoides corti]
MLFTQITVFFSHTNERQTPIEILPAGPSPVRRPEEKRRSRRPTSAPGSRAEDRFFNELLVVPGRLQGQSVFIHLNTASTYSLISKHCAERCGLMKYLSRSTDIVVNGVEAIGHLHFCYVTLGDVTIEVSLIVVETLLHDIVLGLDTLKRHGFCIDLGRGELVIGRCGRSRSRRRPDSRVSRKKSFRKARTPVDDNLKRSSTPSHELKVWESGRQKARSDRRTPSKRRHSTFSRSEEKQIRRMIREEFPPNYAVPLVSSSRTGK